MKQKDKQIAKLEEVNKKIEENAAHEIEMMTTGTRAIFCSTRMTNPRARFLFAQPYKSESAQICIAGLLRFFFVLECHEFGWLAHRSLLRTCKRPAQAAKKLERPSGQRVASQKTERRDETNVSVDEGNVMWLFGCVMLTKLGGEDY